MQRSRVDVILHAPCATWHREPLLTPVIEDRVHRALRSEAQALGCIVLAVGGTDNHVHLVVAIHSTQTIADLMRRVKSVSSMADRKACGGFFGWQDNCGVTSVSPRDRGLVIEYVTNQKQHHASGTLWPSAEAYPDRPEHAVATHPEDG